MLYSLLLQAAAFTTAIAANSATASSAPASDPEEFDWLSVVPSEDLKYHDCYDGFKCARLAVPLDWRNDRDGRTVAIAIVKLPAVVPDDDPAFGGSIFLNPGGPGGSGVNYAVRRAAAIQKFLVDKQGVRHYEIVSFDPRGIGRTTPITDCFRSDDFARAAWVLENRAKGSLNAGGGAIPYGLGLAKSFAMRCELEEGDSAVRYVNTPSVARDMVEMIDKIDELRKQEATKKQEQKPQQLAEGEEEVQDGNEAQVELRKRGQENTNDLIPRLQYIGFSYGTVLGNTFASMFPGRVGRLVLDGVADAMDYSNGDGWLTNLEDTDKMFDEFWKGCFAAETTRCPFRKSDDNHKAAQKRFWSWISDLDRYPVAMGTANGGLMALRGEDVLNLVGGAMYKPLQQFHPLALALYKGMKGNLTRIANWVNTDIPKIGDACRAKNNSGLPDPKDEGGTAVICGDGTDISGRSTDWWKSYVKQQKHKSKVFGSFWSAIRFSCSGWPFRPNWTYRGPFSTPKHSSDPLYTGRPAAPLLFLSSRLDPVTPLRAARSMAKGHPGSAVVIQDSMGHCTWSSAPSKCTWKIVADYFHYGTVPDKETVCPADCGPWDKSCDVPKVFGTYGVDEGEWKAMLHLGEPLRLRQFPLGME